MGGLRVVSGPDFDRAIGGPIPVLVDFWASWCAPCRTMDPVLETLAVCAASVLDVVKVDVEQSEDIARRFGVRALPTFILFVDTEPKVRIRGAMSAERLLTKLGTHVDLAMIVMSDVPKPDLAGMDAGRPRGTWIGSTTWTRAWLEKQLASGVPLRARIIGTLTIEPDVDPDLVGRAIERVRVFGRVRASDRVRAVLAAKG